MLHPSHVKADPRVCGGNLKYHSWRRVPWGRSPRMRGKLLLIPAYTVLSRPIPAYAGETNSAFDNLCTDEADPRVCGGNVLRTLCPACQVGRSPRMRGKHNGLVIDFILIRPIPAYAGETKAQAIVFLPSQADPRVCGGNCLHGLDSFLKLGRSPRMRGKRWHAARVKRSVRPIPAYAGETLIRLSFPVLVKADPRVCGGNIQFHGKYPGKIGRSPRMRGKLFNRCTLAL